MEGSGLEGDTAVRVHDRKKPWAQRIIKEICAFLILSNLMVNLHVHVSLIFAVKHISPRLSDVGHSSVRSPPPVRERLWETIFWLLHLVCSGESEPAAQRFLQDAFSGCADGAALL